MSRKQANLVGIQFKGTSLTPIRARLVEIEATPDTKPFMHIERKGSTWLVLCTYGCFSADRFPDVIELAIERPADDRFFRDVYTGELYEIKGLTKVNVKEPLFHIDRIGTEGRYGSWRLTFSDGLMDDTQSLQAIRIERLF